MSDIITRRSVLAGTATAALVGPVAVVAASPKKQHWDHEVDVLIAGFGLAACSAAIEAHATDPKARILILEKADEANAGGDTRASGQGLVIPKDKDAMVRYHRNLYAPNPVPDDLLEFYVDELMVLHPWIEERAKEASQAYIQLFAIYEFPELGGADAVLRQATILPRAGGLWQAFKKNVLKRPATASARPVALPKAELPEEEAQQAQAAEANALQPAQPAPPSAEELKRQKEEAAKKAAEEAQQAQERARLIQQRQENCNRAQAALRTLQSDVPLAQVGADGQHTTMSDAQRQQDIQRAQSVIARDCGPVPDDL